MKAMIKYFIVGKKKLGHTSTVAILIFLFTLKDSVKAALHLLNTKITIIETLHAIKLNSIKNFDILQTLGGLQHSLACMS